MLLLDTSAVSAFMHRQADALRRLKQEDPSSVYLCTPVAAEIHFGLERLETGSRRRQLLEQEYRRLRSAVRWTDWSDTHAAEFGKRKAELQRRGIPIEDMDQAVASIALGLGARLATHNARHFVRIESLSVDDWSESPES